MNPADYKLMVVDDDAENADLMIDHLRACGYRVVAVKSAATVWKKALRERPSLIVIDLMAPSRVGLKVCRELSLDLATRQIPLIMVTGCGDESDKILALELGVDDYLTKPVNLHELNLRVERSLGRWSSRGIPTRAGSQGAE